MSIAHDQMSIDKNEPANSLVEFYFICCKKVKCNITSIRYLSRPLTWR